MNIRLHLRRRQDTNAAPTVTSGADLVEVRNGVLSGADFREHDLRGADFSGADLTGADFTGARLDGANLHYANLTGTRLCGTSLVGASLLHTGLHNTDFTDADLTYAHVFPKRVDGARFSGSRSAILTFYGTCAGDAHLLPTPQGWYLFTSQGGVNLAREVEPAGVQWLDMKDPEQALLSAVCTFHIAKHRDLIETLSPTRTGRV